MMGYPTFSFIRSTATAVLLSALLILGHVLLTTTANAPVAIHLIPHLGKAITILSSLIFFTLLWTGFTLLEQTDKTLFPEVQTCNDERDDEDDSGSWMFHGRTWVQVLGGTIVLASWGAYWNEALLVMTTYSPEFAPQLIFIRFSYSLVLFALITLQLQLVGSIISYAINHGVKSLDGRFWNGRVGWWTERIQLDLDVEEVGESKV